MISTGHTSAAERAVSERIRVLVVDDSVVMRRIISESLQKDSEIEVVGAAANGQIALQRIDQLKPNAITLDVEMPEMDGLTALRHIRERHPSLAVIMLSSHTERGAAVSLEALAKGASDFIAKPMNNGSRDKTVEALRDQLIPRLKNLCRPVRRIVTPAATLPEVVDRRPRRSVTAKPRAVVIGVSTGGPNALAALLPRIPKEFPLPILIVQHMPPVFTRLLAQRLQSQSALRVEEATAGRTLEPGLVLIAPGDFHLTVEKKGLHVVAGLNQDPPENSCRPAVDVLFRSAQHVYGGDVIAVVLTGMGRDGLAGVQQLKPNGALVIAQDQATSVVWGMPREVVQAGLADDVLALDRIAERLIQATGCGS